MEFAGLDAFARRYGVQLVLQHGSTVSGLSHEHSDLDLAVLLDRVPESTDEYLGLLADLQGLFPGTEIDVTLLNHADPLLLKRVTEHCRLLYGSSARFRDLKLYAFKRYQDHRRFLSLEREYVRRRLAASPR